MLKIGFVIFPGFGVMSFSAISVFETANAQLAEPFYDVRLVSESGGLVRSSMGIAVETEALGDIVFDTMIIGGGGDMPFTPGLLAGLRRGANDCRRLAATCTGAFFLAEAGLLDRARITTHWFFASDFRVRYPKIKLEENRLFIVDGAIWTSAGMAAGIHQALAMIEGDLGASIAGAVSKNFVLHHRRTGGQTQSSTLLDFAPKSDRIQSSLAYARNNIHAQLSIEKLAEAAHLSPRQFSRVFKSDTGTSPAKAVEKLRIEAARLLVQDGRHSIEVIAQQTGFGDSERMRRAFLREFGKPPQALRRSGRSEAQLYHEADRETEEK